MNTLNLESNNRGDILKFWLGNYRITSPYGPRIHPITAQASVHSGIDLVTSHRSPIPALVPGQVIFAGWGSDRPGHYSYGNLVIIADCQGAHHVYAHLDAVLVATDDWLRAGTILGLQGATGRVTGSHLHYEVRRRGNYESHTEPVEYLSQYYELHKELLK